MSTREQASTGFSGRPSGCQPGAARLQSWLGGQFGLSNVGCFNPHSTLSSGSPSWHVYGKAIDMGCNYNDGAARARGDRCFQWVYDHREELNLQQMIWGNRIYDVSYGSVRNYAHGDHKTHIHIAIGYAASQNWHPGAGPGPSPRPVPEEDDMKEDERNWLYGTALLVAKHDEQIKQLIAANYEGGDVTKQSRLRHIQRALFPNDGDTSRTSRPAAIYEVVIALARKAGIPV